jgi:hypothetical protein
MISGLGRHEHDVGLGWAATSAHSVSPARHENNRHDAAHVLARGPIAHLAQPARSYIKNTHLPLTLASLPQSPPPSFLPQPQAEPQAAAGISTVATVSHFRHRYRPPHPPPPSFPRHTWRRRSPPLPPRTWRRYDCDEEAPAGCGLRLDPWPLHAVGRAPRSRICGPTSTRGEEVIASPSPLRQLRCRLLRWPQRSPLRWAPLPLLLPLFGSSCRGLTRPRWPIGPAVVPRAGPARKNGLGLVLGSKFSP